MEAIDKVKTDVTTIRNKVIECQKKNLSKFDIEMTLMTELPELYSDYPWLIKSFSRSASVDEFMKMINKMFANLETVDRGDETLAAVEMKLGQELFDHYIGDKIPKNPDAPK
jgi:hypothetical protein